MRFENGEFAGLPLTAIGLLVAALALQACKGRAAAADQGSMQADSAAAEMPADEPMPAELAWVIAVQGDAALKTIREDQQRQMLARMRPALSPEARLVRDHRLEEMMIAKAQR